MSDVIATGYVDQNMCTELSFPNICKPFPRIKCYSKRLMKTHLALLLACIYLQYSHTIFFPQVSGATPPERSAAGSSLPNVDVSHAVVFKPVGGTHPLATSSN